MLMSRDGEYHLKTIFLQGKPGPPGKLTPTQKQPSDQNSPQTKKSKTKPKKNAAHKHPSRTRETADFTGGNENVGFNIYSRTLFLCLHVQYLNCTCSGRGLSWCPGDGQEKGTTLTGHREPKMTPPPPATN